MVYKKLGDRNTEIESTILENVAKSNLMRLPQIWKRPMKKRRVIMYINLCVISKVKIL